MNVKQEDGKYGDGNSLHEMHIMCWWHEIMNGYYRGGWFNGYGFTPKSLGGGGPKFESHNRKHLGNNFMLSAHAY